MRIAQTHFIMLRMRFLQRLKAQENTFARFNLATFCLVAVALMRYSRKPSCVAGVGSEADFEAFFSSNSGQVEQGAWSCFLCGKITQHSGNMRQHFEAHHFSLPVGLVQCRMCNKIFKTRHSLATHMSKNHRDANRY